MALLPLIPTDIRKQALLGQIGDPAAPNLPQAMPQLDAPIAPMPTVDHRLGSEAADPLVQRSGDDSADLYRRTHPIAPTTALGKIGHAAANVGNVLGNIFAPSAMSVIPHTQLYNQNQIGKDKQDLDNVSQLQTEADQRKGIEATTAYTTARPAIEQSKILQKLTSSLAPKGIIPTLNSDGSIDVADDPNSQAFKNQQALSEMHSATADKEAITSDIAKNHYVPGTPEYVEAQRKLAQVDSRLHVAIAGLGLRAEGLNLRKENTQAALYGTDLSGNALPGAPIITGEDGQQTVVGQKNAGHAITQQKTVGSFNDLAGSVDHTDKALRDFFSEGGSLADPKVIAALHDPQSMTAQYISGLVNAGLSPKAIAAVTAIRQNHEQAGILRSTTGGTASEAGAQRILETTPMAGDTNDIALQKVAEQRNVLGRLTPGQTRVAGGQAVHTPNGSKSAPKVGDTKEFPNGKTGVWDGTGWEAK
jgi:hypothetical protein